MARPHLIFLMADQLRYDVLGAYGDQQCPTPALDKLAQLSVVFERHFTPSPQDVPARASIITGLPPRQHGAIINGWFPAERPFGVIRPGLDLLPQRLIDAGYRFVHVGVQQVRADRDLTTMMPTAEFIGPVSSGDHLHSLQARGLNLGDTAALRDPVLDFDRGRPVIFSSTSPRSSIFPLRDELFYDDVISRKIVEVIQTHAAHPEESGEKKPLALMGMFWLPHPPLWAPRGWAAQVEPENVTLPAAIGKWFPGMPAMQLANIPGQLGAHVSIDQWRAAWATYLGMTAMLDECVRRVLAALDHTGMFEDSLIIFTSDHGEMLGSHRLFGKMCMYEEAVRVPLIVKLPGQSRGRRVLEMSDHLDLPATMLDFAGSPPLRDSPGQSLRALAEGRPSHDPRPAVFASYDGNAGRGFAQRMIRTVTHKLIHNVGDQPELYDVIEDPRETRNLAGQEPVREVERDLRRRLNAWMDEAGDDQTRC